MYKQRSIIGSLCIVSGFYEKATEKDFGGKKKRNNLENCHDGMLIYGKWKINKNTWCVTDLWKSFIYLLIGEEKALLIDTCSGEGNLQSVVEEITDKPVIVVNTHGNFDHTGGNGCWKAVWMAKEAEVASRRFVSLEHEQNLRLKLHPDYKTQYLKDGQIFKLGERNIEAISIAAHSEGSFVFLDSNMKSLFSGDEILSGQVLCFVRNQAVDLREFALRQKKNFEKLNKRSQEVDYIWPSHNGGPLDAKTYLDDFMALDQEILEEKVKVEEGVTGFGFSGNLDSEKNVFHNFAPLYRVKKGVASLIYAEKKTSYEMLARL